MTQKEVSRIPRPGQNKPLLKQQSATSNNTKAAHRPGIHIRALISLSSISSWPLCAELLAFLADIAKFASRDVGKPVELDRGRSSTHQRTDTAKGKDNFECVSK